LIITDVPAAFAHYAAASFVGLSKADATAIAASLKSTPPIKHQGADSLLPGEKITAFLFRISLPEGTAAAK
jgi:hypothetical protein